MHGVFCFALFATVEIGKEVHTWDAESYHAHSFSQEQAAKDLVTQLNFQGSEQVLDIGCGDGKITVFVASLVPHGHVVGIDLSASMIAFARSNVGKKSLNVDFRIADAHSLHFDEDFDTIVSFTALQWAQDHHRVLREIKDALKPNGTFACTMWAELPNAFTQALDDIKKSWEPHFQGFTSTFNFIDAQAYRSILESQGFYVKKADLIEQNDVFASKEAMVNFVLQWLPEANVLPQNRRRDFVVLVIDRFIELDEQISTPPFYFRVVRLEAIGVKPII